MTHRELVVLVEVIFSSAATTCLVFAANSWGPPDQRLNHSDVWTFGVEVLESVKWVPKSIDGYPLIMMFFHIQMISVYMDAETAIGW